MTGLRTLRAARAAAVVAVLLAVAAGVPAAAHSVDPRIVTTLTDVEPALPLDVVVQVQASLAAQLVADNPTPAPLEVLGRDGRPFLRLSSSGVEADVTHPDFLSTSSPTAAVPPGTDDAPDRPARWAQISSGSSWGWFDHRLHPGDLAAPADEQRAALLGEWSVPLRYDGADVSVRGSVEFVPLLGAFVPVADAAPEPLVVQALPGRLPGIFLSNPERRPLTVLGRDGEPFLRFGPDGVEVNTASRTHVEDRLARGQLAGPPSPEPSFELVDGQGTSYSWLDARLRYADDLPPDDVLRAGETAVVQQWQVPVEGPGGLEALTGEVRWVPEQGAVAARQERRESGLPTAAVVAAVAAVVLAAAVVLVRRRRPV